MILAILIVALIGVVAASYHDEVVDGIQMFQQLDDQSNTYSDEAIDVALEEGMKVNEAPQSGSQQQINTPTNTQPRITQIVTKPYLYNMKYKNQIGKTNQTSSNNNNANNTNITPTNNNTNNTNITPTDNKTENKTTISIAEAKVIATNWAANQGTNGATIKHVSTDNAADGGKLYTFNIIKKGEIIGSVEIDAETGKVVGGAIKNEAPDVDDKTHNDTGGESDPEPEPELEPELDE